MRDRGPAGDQVGRPDPPGQERCEQHAGDRAEDGQDRTEAGREGRHAGNEQYCGTKSIRAPVTAYDVAGLVIGYAIWNAVPAYGRLS